MYTTTSKQLAAREKGNKASKQVLSCSLGCTVETACFQLLTAEAEAVAANSAREEL